MLSQIIHKPCANCDGEGITPSKAYLKWLNCPEEYKEKFDKDCPIKQCEICKGSGDRPYHHGEQERFYLLANRWEKETCLSSKIEVNHPCFIEMKNMKSRESIGWVLARVHQKKSWILALLTIWIDEKDNPITDDMAGNLNKLTEAWLQWAKEKRIEI